MQKFLLIGLLLTSCFDLLSQTSLDADGPGNTYELITSVLAPNYDPIEVPDCGHTAFGRHIDEIFDADLNQHVFRFFIHPNEDDDRCQVFDRQRNEIKTYDKSPDNLLGIQGETFLYQWKFKLDAGFQPSPNFTHIHQLKARGGSEDSHPVITLTPRKATPNRLELRHGANTSSSSVLNVDLATFLGVWCEVTETVLYGENGTYSIEIKKVSDGTVLMTYSNNNLRMWRTGADFIRPKWGIYRSLNSIADLRDEEVLFANFLIHENPALPVELLDFTAKLQDEEVILAWQTASEYHNRGFEVQKSVDAEIWTTLGFVEGSDNSNTSRSYELTDQEPVFGQNYYRLKQVDWDNSFQYSDTVVIDFVRQDDVLQIAPNPAAQELTIIGLQAEVSFTVFHSSGKKVLEGQTNSSQLNVSFLSKGVYFLQLEIANKKVVKRFVKK